MNLNPINYHHRLLLIRQLSSSIKKSSNHYDALGITKNATVADIKSAYYKLSMIYHPDKNPDNNDNNKNDNNNNNSTEASQKFRDITEAYKVLSNLKTRKLYDRGLLMNNTYSTTTSADDIDLKSKFYQSRERRSRAPTSTGRTVIYDFDEWTRTHYGATFVRDMQNKQRRQKQENFRKIVSEDIKSERMLIVIVTAFVFCTLILHGRRDADNIQTTKQD